MDEIMRQTDEQPIAFMQETFDGNIITYTVQRGDNLTRIANRYGVTVQAILNANPSITNPNRIFPGQVIRIVGGVSDWITHIVQRGDTLSRIARQYGVTVQAILNINPSITNPNRIFIGQVIRIMSGPSSGIITHTVQRGDTLSRIAKQYGVTVQAILNVNPQITNPNRIFPGQVITIPAGSVGPGDYSFKYVRPEDFPQISRQRLQSVDMSLSGLSNTRLDVVKEGLRWAYDAQAAASSRKLSALYIYGMNLYDTSLNVQKATADIINRQASMYPSFFNNGRKEWMLKRVAENPDLGCADCSGFLVGFLRKFKLVSNTFDTTANNFLSNLHSSMTTMAGLKPGDWVGKSGHIGLYVGGGYVVAFEGGAYACQISNLSNRSVYDFVRNTTDTMAAWTKFVTPKYY